ncbi:hypothetical protein A2U01_0109751 [Trifolium medium]|uniref:Uncharacterized protein n=1 Tax=Trifolium medium TaxID=97028 RepID=A0A392VJ99_9FABA|nr:hypothetical protein [Trifolium medium]
MQDDASSEEVSSEALALHEKGKLEDDIDKAVKEDGRRMRAERKRKIGG